MVPPPLPISVIVPTRDTRALTLRCLASLAASERAAAEILVVDDGSGDGTAEAVRAACPSARLLRHESPSGFTASVNEAWPLATSAIVLFLNSDTEVDARALEGVVDAFARDPRLGIAGASLRDPDGRLQWSAGPEPTVAWLFALASGGATALAALPGWRAWRTRRARRARRGRRAPAWDADGARGVDEGLRASAAADAAGASDASTASRALAPSRTPAASRMPAASSAAAASSTLAASRDVAWVPATAMAVRREVREAIGLFDVSLRVYAQDLDYCLRARAAGWRIVQLPDVSVTHLLGGTIGASEDAVASRQDPRALFTDLARWIRKTHSPARARRACRALVLGARARIAARNLTRWFVARAVRAEWDRDTDRYRAALAALEQLLR